MTSLFKRSQVHQYALACLLLLACGPVRTPSPPVAVRVSGQDPVAAACRGAVGPSTVEPQLAADPRDSSHLLAAWQQDRDSRGGALVVALAETKDGGRTWTRSLLPGVSRCSGGSADVASDPWASFGPDGALYVSTLSVDFNGSWSVLVSTRARGARGFAAPVTIRSRRAPQIVDKPVILADPSRAGTVYAAWVESAGGEDDSSQRVGFASSADGGRTWTEPRVIWGDGLHSEQGSQLLSSGGVLYDVLVEGPRAIQDGSSGQVVALRSLDGGATWSLAGRGPSFPLARVFDSAASKPVRAPSVVEGAAAGPRGVLYAAWFAGEASSTSIQVARSPDGGASWDAPVTVSAAGGRAFLPILAVDGSGRLAAAWYQLRPGDRIAEAWLAVSSDGGRGWSRRKLGAPFDLGRAPVTEGVLFLGDYSGLAGLRRGFGVLWVEARAEGTSVWFFREGS